MSDQNADLDAALERVIAAARAHLAAIKAAEGRIDDDDVWQAYVDLNNASFSYDEKLLDAFGEVTPWDVESIDPDEADQRFGLGVGGIDGAEAARAGSVPEDEDPGVVESVGEAVLELLQAGDGSLSSLDVPELEPLDGLLTVSEITQPLDLEAYEDSDGDGPFAPKEGDLLVGRLDEHPFLPDEEEDHAGHNH